MNSEKRYFLVLHGAQSPGEDARLALRTALSAVLQFDTIELNRIFSALPSVLRNELTKEEAERLMLSVESLDGDVEMLEQQDLFADDQTSESEPANKPIDSKSLFALAESDELVLAPEPVEPERSLNDDIFEKEPAAEEEDFSFSLKLDEETTPVREAVETSTTASAEQAIKSAPRLFQLEGEDDLPVIDSTSSAPQSTTHQHGPLFETADPTEVTETGIEAAHSQIAPTTQPGETPTGLKPDDTSPAATDQEDDWRKVPVDWTPPQTSPLRKKNHANSVMWVASFLIAAATAYLFLTPGTSSTGDRPYSVEQLIEAQQQHRDQKHADAITRAPAAVAFDSKFYGEQRFDNLTVQLEVGHSVNGLEISEVVAFSEEPPLPTKQQYMNGARRPPWLRRFEAKRPVSVQKGAPASESLNDSISGRIVIQDEAGPHSFVATVSATGTLGNGATSVSGEWRLSNIELPEDFSDTFLIRQIEKGRFEVIGKGPFDLQRRPGKPIDAAPSGIPSEPSAEPIDPVEE